jgi:curli biogenesis system outer membrane secretion channel CsgG
MKKISSLFFILTAAACLHAQTAKPAVRLMVITFDNKANVRDRQENTAFDSSARYTDRYSVIIREEVENWFSNQDGIKVTERAEVDDVMKEMTMQNKGAGGVFDESTVISFGKLRGANYLVSGAILQISRRNNSFKGYNTEFNVQTDNLRFRMKITDIARNEQVYSGTYSVKLPVVQTKHGETTDSDIGGTLAGQVSARLDDDEKLQTAIQKLVKPAKAAPSAAPAPPAILTIEVSIAPKPDNCEIEIGGMVIGTSSVTTKLSEGAQVIIKITKPGYEPWERRVLVGDGLKLTPELKKIE